MNTKTETRKIPAPLYAAAGAGDLAYEQLRKLPERVAELRERVNEIRPVVTDVVSERSLRSDIDRLRAIARRNAETFVTGVEAAQERATEVYLRLVARGERLVADARTAEAKAQLKTARAEIKDAATTELVTDGKVEQERLPSVATKPTKRTRPAGQK
jgi:heparin binding hemagglutinin HbhA